MVRPYAKRTVNFSQDTVWKLLCDLESPSRFHPYIQDVRISSSQRQGLGSRRIIHYVDGSKDVEEVVQVGQGSITFKPSSGAQDGKSSPLYTVTYTVTRILPTWTEITLEARDDFPLRFLGILQQVFPPPAKRNLHRTFYHVLEGIEYHLSTQKPVRKLPCSHAVSMSSTSLSSWNMCRRGHSSAVGTT